VRFQSGNLLDPGLALPTDAYDFVFCRNLLIYFDNPTQEAAVAVLRRLCRRDGVIFVGPAEASLLTRLGMKQIDAARAFAFRNAQDGVALPDAQRGRETARPLRAGASRPARAQANPPGSPAANPQAGPTANPRLRAAGTDSPARMNAARASAAGTNSAAPPRAGQAAAAGTDSAALPKAAQASATVQGSRPGGAREAGPASLAAIQALADAGRLDEARAAAVRHVDAHGASAEAYYLIGLLDDAANLSTAAEAAYRKTLYLDPAHRQALLHLASLLETRGEIAPARQLRTRAARSENRHA
jgi:chemotaxis protein methyltransferase WspC